MGSPRWRPESWTLRPRGRQDGPDRESHLVGAHAPGLTEMGHDGQAASAHRRRRRLADVRHGGAASVAHGDLDRAAVDGPRDLKPFSRKRVRVHDGVAQQLADDEGRIAHRIVRHACRLQFADKSPAHDADAGWRARQVHDARHPHLPAHQLPPRRDHVRAADGEMPRLTPPETGKKRGEYHSPAAAGHAIQDSDHAIQGRPRDPACPDRPFTYRGPLPDCYSNDSMGGAGGASRRARSRALTSFSGTVSAVITARPGSRPHQDRAA